MTLVHKSLNLWKHCLADLSSTLVAIYTHLSLVGILAPKSFMPCSNYFCWSLLQTSSYDSCLGPCFRSSWVLRLASVSFYIFFIRSSLSYSSYLLWSTSFYFFSYSSFVLAITSFTSLPTNSDITFQRSPVPGGNLTIPFVNC